MQRLSHQASWSSFEVSKLISLISSEHQHAKAVIDALPIGVGMYTVERQLKWANDPFRAIIAALDDAELHDAVQKSLDSGNDIEINAAEKGAFSICTRQSPFFPGEFMVILTRAAPAVTIPPISGADMLSLCAVPLLVYEPDGRILFANGEATDISGYDPEALRAAGMNVIFPEQNQVLTVDGKCIVTLYCSSGKTTQVHAVVKSIRTTTEPAVFCITIIDTDASRRRSENLAALEGCLLGAFPTSSITRTFLAGTERFGLRAGCDCERRFLTVTHSALQSDRLRDYLRDVTEALKVTTAVALTENGVSVIE